MAKHHLVLAVLCVALATIAGCGGGSAGSPADTTVKAGSMSVTGQGVNQSVLVNDTTVHSLTGSLTNATYNDLDPTVEETEIFYGARAVPGKDWAIFAVGFDGSGRRKVADTSMGPARVRVNPAGTYVYYATMDAELYRVPTAGGAPVLIQPDVYTFAISPNGSLVFRKEVHDGWWKAGAAGGSPTLLTASTSFTEMVGFTSPSSFRVFSKNYPITFAEIDANNGTTLDQASTGTGFGDYASVGMNGLPMWGYMYDGVWSLFRSRSLSIDPGSSELRITGIPGLADHGDIGASPDGSHVAFARVGTSGFNINVADRTSIREVASEAAVFAVGWGPYVKSRVFVGEGLFAAGAGAVLFSEKGSVLPSVVVADAVTRTTCAVTPMSAQGDQNTVFKLTCDNLKKLYFSNTVNHALNPVVTAATGIRGAYISFTASTGKIASITTFKAPPSATRTPEGIVLEGGEMVEHVTPVGRRALSLGARVSL